MGEFTISQGMLGLFRFHEAKPSENGTVVFLIQSVQLLPSDIIISAQINKHIIGLYNVGSTILEYNWRKG